MWRILFSASGTDLRAIPPPSATIETDSGIVVFEYGFRNMPKTWYEFQTIGKIKCIIAQRTDAKIMNIQEYSRMMMGSVHSEYRTYSTRELFTLLDSDVCYPQFLDLRQAFLGSLTGYAKRLVYEGLYSLEKLISTALWYHEATTGRPLNDADRKRIITKQAWKVHALIQEEWENIPTKLGADELERSRIASRSKGGLSRSAAYQEKRDTAAVMLADGKSNKVIADALGVSARTVINWKKQFAKKSKFGSGS